MGGGKKNGVVSASTRTETETETDEQDNLHGKAPPDAPDQETPTVHGILSGRLNETKHVKFRIHTECLLVPYSSKLSIVVVIIII